MTEALYDGVHEACIADVSETTYPRCNLKNKQREQQDNTNSNRLNRKSRI